MTATANFASTYLLYIKLHISIIELCDCDGLMTVLYFWIRPVYCGKSVKKRWDIVFWWAKSETPIYC